MADNLKRRSPEDPNKINVKQPWELDYWAQYFGVSEEKLKQAVKAVGPLVKDVKRYLQK